jgi:saccharopine dehydrogenase-like NADP-dependent oxidoreductase
MREILVLGAGQSAPFLIRHLLDRAAEGDWRVTVGDRDRALAERRVAGHPRGRAIAFDAAAEPAVGADPLAAADLVVSLLPPPFHPAVARRCVAAGTSLVTASYTDPRLAALDAEAKARGVLLLNEMGLDPGIDHMSAMELLDRVRAEGGEVESFESYGSGVPAPDSRGNPLGYAVTWNARNVVMAGSDGAQYLRGGRIRRRPWRRVFAETWTVEVDGVGTMEAYPNRDSLAYRGALGLGGAATLIRGTLRWPGFVETWRQVVRLGLPDEKLPVPGLPERTWAELVAMHLPENAATVSGDTVSGNSVSGDTLSGDTLSGDVAGRAAAFLGLDPAGEVMGRLRWLGLFDDVPIGGAVGGAPTTTAEALAALLSRKLTLPEGGRDMVVLRHELTVRRPDGSRERRTATLVEYGERVGGGRGGVTAMARTVGLPAAVAARLRLAGRLDLAGCRIPTDPRIYRPVLAELEREGLRFEERRAPAQGSPGRVCSSA